jgi:hypothetical protein
MSNIDKLVDFYSSLSEEEKRKNQLLFIENIYPSIDRRIKDLELEIKYLKCNIASLERQKYEEQVYFFQYKNKIQRIEQFLIEQGVIRCLGKVSKE